MELVGGHKSRIYFDTTPLQSYQSYSSLFTTAYEKQVNYTEATQDSSLQPMREQVNYAKQAYLSFSTRGRYSLSFDTATYSLSNLTIHLLHLMLL